MHEILMITLRAAASGGLLWGVIDLAVGVRKRWERRISLFEVALWGVYGAASGAAVTAAITFLGLVAWWGVA